MATTHSTASSPRRQRAAATYEAVKQWHAPVRQAIRQAVQLGSINVPAGEFLHWLLGQAGDKSYVALPKTELAQLYPKSLSSIKLYLRTGVEKNFLRVSGSRIYFVQLEAPSTSDKTYDELVEEATKLAAADDLINAALLLKQAAKLRQREQEQTEEPSAPEAEQPPFFLVEDESKNCPDSDNSLSRSSIKTLNSPGGGGKRDIKKLSLEELAAIQALPHVAKLRAVGSVVQQCWIRLADRPITEIDRACQLALKATWANDPGAVAIWYADQIAAGLIPLDDPAPPPASPARDAPTPPVDLLDAQWAAAQAALKQQVSIGEYETWLTETRLIAHEDGQAFIGVPNIFAREKLEAVYLSAIEQALLTALGSAVRVQIVIDSGGIQ